jgi:hypothetical protein
VTRCLRRGAPAPEVLDEVTLEGRFGIVLSRLHGPTSMQLSRSGAMTPAETGAIVASTCPFTRRSRLRTSFLRDCLAALHLSGGIVPKPIATGILTLIERLRPEDGMGPAELAIPPTDHDSGWCGRAVRVGAAVRLLPSGATAAMEPLRPNRLTHSNLTWRPVARKCRPPYIPVPWP